MVQTVGSLIITDRYSVSVNCSYFTNAFVAVSSSLPLSKVCLPCKHFVVAVSGGFLGRTNRLVILAALDVPL